MQLETSRESTPGYLKYRMCTVEYWRWDYNNGSQGGVGEERRGGMLPPKEHSALSGDISGCHNLRGLLLASSG